MSAAIFDLLVQGFPGSSPSNGGLGWSSVGLVQTADSVVVLDTGPFGARELVRQRLREHGLETADVTDVVLTHAHHDHCINWPMFPNAHVHVSAEELAWSQEVPLGTTPVAEFSMRELAARGSTVAIEGSSEVLPGIYAHQAPGHTPGSLVIEVRTPGAPTYFLGDAVKNRAELVGGVAEHSTEPDLSTRTIRRAREEWLAIEGTVLVPGHDLPLMRRGAKVVPLGAREGTILARFGTDLGEVTRFHLTNSAS